MPRDKFAAMSERAAVTKVKAADADNEGNNASNSDAPQQQQQQQQKQQDVSITAASPKSGKFVAMAAQANNNNDGSSDNNTVKIDLQQQEQQQLDGISSVTTTTTTTPPLSPRRDELTAITARSNSDPSTTATTTATTTTTAATTATTTAATATATATTNPTDIPENQSAQTPRRNNKFAAMAARSSNVGDGDGDGDSDSGGDAGGNIVAATTTTLKVVKTDEEKAAEAIIEKQKYLTKLKERLSKRRTILNSLDRAEELTCNLLKIAAKTTVALQDLNYSPDLTGLSVSYRSTLQELHPLLTMGTEELIKPYQNHTKETKQSMYAARVEMRLAKERLEVLKTFTELEKEDSSSNKKQQQQQQATANNNDADTVIENHYDESDRKRKR